MRKLASLLCLPALALSAGGCGWVIVETPPEKLPPIIVGIEQSSPFAEPGQGVAFEVNAVDPQNSPLTFSWQSTRGILGKPESSANKSLMPWAAPPCLDGSPDPTITVTVTNAFSLSALADFKVGGLSDCATPPLPPADAVTQEWNTGGEVDQVVVPPGKSFASFLVWGAGGGGGAPGPGGGGAWLSAQFSVTPGDHLEVRVASGGEGYGGGGGASYVLRNGEIMLVAAGGGGGGVDGCTGCTKESEPPAGMGGAGGPVGGNGQDGLANNYIQTNSGAGSGGQQLAGGAAGISNDQNPYGYDPCTINGQPGAENQGGVAAECAHPPPKPAKGHLGGEGIGNGSSGGGGSGRFGGGSGAAKWTYTGGGGGGGSSWIHPSAKLLDTQGGKAQAPGGQNKPAYHDKAGRGGDPNLEPFGEPAKPGEAGLIVMTL